jgi:hypothetical protein
MEGLLGKWDFQRLFYEGEVPTLEKIITESPSLSSLPDVGQPQPELAEQNGVKAKLITFLSEFETALWSSSERFRTIPRPTVTQLEMVIPTVPEPVLSALVGEQVQSPLVQDGPAMVIAIRRENWSLGMARANITEWEEDGLLSDHKDYIARYHQRLAALPDLKLNALREETQLKLVQTLARIFGEGQAHHRFVTGDQATAWTFWKEFVQLQPEELTLLQQQGWQFQFKPASVQGESLTQVIALKRR